MHCWGATLWFSVWELIALWSPGKGQEKNKISPHCRSQRSCSNISSTRGWVEQQGRLLERILAIPPLRSDPLLTQLSTLTLGNKKNNFHIYLIPSMLLWKYFKVIQFFVVALNPGAVVLGDFLSVYYKPWSSPSPIISRHKYLSSNIS